MKATIDREGCIECGLCESTCPEVFLLDQEGKATVIVDVIPPEAEQTAIDAQDGCPVSVITVE